MKVLKKISIVFVLLLLIGLSACGQRKPAASAKKVVYATFFPVEDLARRIIGDKMEIRTIMSGSEEPHDFELKVSAMAELTKADLIIFNGANMEGFIDDLRKEMNQDEKFLDLSQGLTLLESDSHHDHAEEEHAHEEDEHHNHGSVNPHTWLSVKNAIIELDTLYRKVSSIDPENESYYKANLENATREFAALDKRFEEELGKVTVKEKYFVVSHAAFNYLAKDYGLRQVAVTGISPEEEPTAKQLKTIADFVKEKNISTIFFEGKATPKVAETLAENTGVKTATLYTMEVLTDAERELGYLTLMERNLQALITAFHE